MDRGKVKTAVIAILLILNLLLGTLLIWRTAIAGKIERDAFDNLKAVMQSNGVTLLLDELPSAEGVYPLLSERSLSTEASLAETLTGSAQGADQGGNIYYYTGELGEAWFRGSGDFEVLFAETVADPEALLKQALLPYGMDPAEEPLVQRVENRKVFNCVVNIHNSAGRLHAVTGRLAVGSFQAVMDQTLIDAATALLRFIASLESSGFICTEVVSMELGYVMTAPAAGSYQLTPVWSVVTDTGEYHINAISGTVERNIV